MPVYVANMVATLLNTMQQNWNKSKCGRKCLLYRFHMGGGRNGL